MRKTFAKKIYEHLGRDLARTQEALGHQHINDTRKYLSFDRTEIDRAILAI
jgi:site-specific recombinase XerD